VIVRDASVSDDDLAIRAAKESLATLAERKGYAAAMRPRKPESRTFQLVMLSLAVAFCLLVAVSLTQMSGSWLRWFVVAAFALLGIFAAMAALGSSPSAPPATWPAAVLGTSLEISDGEESPRVLLLRDDGTEVELPILASLHSVLRPGDVGVAEVQLDAKQLVVGFRRL
jgi:hypothetical protein